MSIKENLETIQEKIELAAQNAGRRSSEIRLMAVSKTKPLELIQEAYDAGQRLFGENRVGEAAEKFAQIPDDAEVHLIGHLQKNKVKTAVPVFDCIQSVDSLTLAERLIRKANDESRSIEVLLQLKTAEEGAKTGFQSEEELLDCASLMIDNPSVTLRGLMTIAPFSDDEKLVRSAFARCRNLMDKLTAIYSSEQCSVLSMGMSSDYEWAIKEGSTLLRVGTALFGGRI